MLSIHRSGFYYKPLGESGLNLKLMQLIDVYFLEHPHSGALTLCAWLCLTGGFSSKRETYSPIDAANGPDGCLPRQKA